MTLTLRFTESFDNSPDDGGDAYNGKWDNLTSGLFVIEPHTGFLGNAARAGAGQRSMIMSLSAAEEALRTLIAFDYMQDVLVSTISNGFFFLAVYTDGGTNFQGGLRTNVIGEIVYQRADGTTLGTSSKKIQAAARHSLELGVVISNTVGEVALWLDDELVINVTNVDTQQTATDPDIDKIEFTGGTNQWFDNISIWSSSVNGEHPGPIDWYALDPNGNGALSEFDGSDGNSVDNYLLVDEATPDGDTTYVESGVDDEQDDYAHENLGLTGSIAGVAQYIRARRSDTDGRDIAGVARLAAGTTSVGADQSLAAGYAWHRYMFQDKPGGGAWTDADIDAATFGYRSRPL